MPDTRKHRGAHPEDKKLFTVEQQSKLVRAVHDFSWLLSRGYASPSALKLVCDRFALTDRQRLAVMRSACSDEELSKRIGKQVSPDAVSGSVLFIDGYNVITTIETAISGGVILRGRDTCLRDIAGVHGTYRKVEETIPSVQLIGKYLLQTGVKQCRWFLDKPVSNSGRLKILILQMAEEQKWDWQVDVVFSPDGVLARTDEIVATSDSDILNRCKRWFNLTGEIINTYIQNVFLVDFSNV